MALTCDSSVLADAAKKFTCLSPDMREAVKTYLLAVMAGGSLDPAELMAQAVCFKCVPDQKALQNYLLCQVLTGCSDGDGPPVVCDYLEGAGDPTGVTTPEFVGQLYHDTNADTYYRSTGLTNADWVIISGGVTGITWTPSMTALGGLEIAFDSTTTSVTVPLLQTVDDITVANLDVVTTITADDLTTVSDQCEFSTNPLLTTLNLASLTSCNGLYIYTNDSIVSIVLPSLVYCLTLFCSDCPLLTSITCPSYVPPDGVYIDVTLCNLNVTTVNDLLARCVANVLCISGTIDLSGGTNAAPAGQGILDKATLIARGLTVTTN